MNWCVCSWIVYFEYVYGACVVCVGGVCVFVFVQVYVNGVCVSSNLRFFSCCFLSSLYLYLSLSLFDPSFLRWKLWTPKAHLRFVSDLFWHFMFVTDFWHFCSRVIIHSKTYRTLLDAAPPPCIPYLGLFLTDLTFLVSFLFHFSVDVCVGTW